LSHTGYKVFLFLSHAVIVNVDTGFLALFTFLAGVVFGTLKYISGSLIPAITAHALFDIIVYAEFVQAPWWVW
jgi:membrane protease YdiL (CAAX protease family)